MLILMIYCQCQTFKKDIFIADKFKWLLNF